MAPKAINATVENEIPKIHTIFMSVYEQNWIKAQVFAFSNTAVKLLSTSVKNGSQWQTPHGRHPETGFRFNCNPGRESLKSNIICTYLNTTY